LVALEAVLRHAAGNGADLMVNLGDCATSPLWPRETFDLMSHLRLPTVRGNHDRLLVDAPARNASAIVAWSWWQLGENASLQLAALPQALSLADDAVLAVHGRPGDDAAYLLEDNIDGRLAYAPVTALMDRLSGVSASLVLCGHSHVQHTARVGDRFVLNPGSVGCPRYAGNTDPMVAEPSSPHARYATVTGRRGRWAADLHVVDYDVDGVIERARANGHPDWARAFEQAAFPM